jgi:hypothetical protein
VNKIYGDTEFSAGKYRHAGHTFEVQRIKIYNDSDCTGNLFLTNNRCPIRIRFSKKIPNCFQPNKPVFRIRVPVFTFDADPVPDPDSIFTL